MPTSTPSTRPLTIANGPTAAPPIRPPIRPTYSGRKAKRGEALLDDEVFVDFKKKKIELELAVIESQARDIAEKTALEKRLLGQQFEESAARTSYFKAATRAINLKLGEPFDFNLNEE